MKITLSYVALNTDVNPPVLTAPNGMTVVATISSLEELLKDCSRVEEEILRLLKEK